MSRKVRSTINRWNVFWLAVGLGGCAITESTIVDLNIPYAPGSVACSSALGSYSLPKSFIRIVVGQVNGAPPDLVVDNLPADGKYMFEITRRADPALTVCLDYLASAFAHDEITVNKQDTSLDEAAKKVRDDGTSAVTSRQFLRSVYVNATDKSVAIARNLIQAAFIGLSGNENFGPEREGLLDRTKTPEILADLEFDPFDTRDTAEANARLSRFGFCLVLEGFTFDRSSLSIDQYCNSPSRVRDHVPQVAELYAIKSREPLPPHTPGLLYRPRQTYLISIYRKPDPGGRKAWQLSRRVDVDLENLSPVVSVGVSRALFARRNGAFVFDEGNLKTVCIAKTSEIENFVAIPFEIARSLVALPAQIVTVKINRIAKEEELARVEDLFIQTQAIALKQRLGQKNVGELKGSNAPYVPIKFDDPVLNKELKSLDPNANLFRLQRTQATHAQLISNLCGPDLIKVPPPDRVPFALKPIQ